MNPKLLVYLDYLLKNSTVPMRLNIDPEKLSPDEILEINIPDKQLYFGATNQLYG